MASSEYSRGFGSGILIGTPFGGGTPQEFGTLQDVTLDISFTTKKLHGQNQFPVAVGRGGASISGKAKFANIDGGILFNLFFASLVPTVQQKLVSYHETYLIPGTPYQITVANATVFDTDLGCAYAQHGVQTALVPVATTPVTGQYHQAAGVYTFAAADTAKYVMITYSYLPVVADRSGKATIVNPLMGYAPTFQIDFYQPNPTVLGGQWSFRLYSCQSSKLMLPTKIDDFTIVEMDFEAFANGPFGALGEFNLATYTA